MGVSQTCWKVMAYLVTLLLTHLHVVKEYFLEWLKTINMLIPLAALNKLNLTKCNY